MNGPLTLLEGAKHSTDMRKRGFVKTLVQESPILEMLPFTPFAGNALKVTVEATLPEPTFRSVNEAYSKTFGSDTERMFGVSILGGEVEIDNYILRVQSNESSVKARQYAKFAKAMSRTFDKQFFDGTGDAADKDFAGVNRLINQGLGSNFVPVAAGASIDLDALDEAFDLFRSQARPDVILANRAVRRQITNVGRNLTGFPLIDVGTDVFGRQVTMYNDTPIRIIGDDREGNAILGFDEDPGGDNPAGTYADATSVYLVAFGEDENVYGLSGLGGSFEVRDFGEQESTPAHLGRVEWYPGIAIDNPFSIVRIAGVEA